MTDDPAPTSRRRKWTPPANETPFEPTLPLPALDGPRRQRADPVEARRAQADYLCLWLACRRALCRDARRCVGTHAHCVFENAGVARPILEPVVEGCWPSALTPGSISGA